MGDISIERYISVRLDLCARIKRRKINKIKWKKCKKEEGTFVCLYTLNRAQRVRGLSLFLLLSSMPILLYLLCVPTLKSSWEKYCVKIIQAHMCVYRFCCWTRRRTTTEQKWSREEAKAKEALALHINHQAIQASEATVRTEARIVSHTGPSAGTGPYIVPVYIHISTLAVCVFILYVICCVYVY